MHSHISEQTYVLLKKKTFLWVMPGTNVGKGCSMEMKSLAEWRGVSHVKIWGKCVLGGGVSYCNYPQIGPILACLRQKSWGDFQGIVGFCFYSTETEN